MNFSLIYFNGKIFAGKVKQQVFKITKRLGITVLDYTFHTLLLTGIALKIQKR